MNQSVVIVRDIPGGFLLRWHSFTPADNFSLDKHWAVYDSSDGISTVEFCLIEKSGVDNSFDFT